MSTSHLTSWTAAVLACALVACTQGGTAQCPPAAQGTPSDRPRGDKESITLITKWTLKPEREQEAIAYIAEFIPKAMSAEPGLMLYTFSKDPSQEHVYYWIESYKNKAAWEAHQVTPYREKAVPLIPTWVAVWPPEVHLMLQQVVPN